MVIMPYTPEQPDFANQPEKEKEEKPPVDPEKEKRGLELADEIKALRAKPQDQMTAEDWQSIIQKAKEIERLFSKEKELFPRGSIIDLVEKLEKASGEEIKDADNIHSQPDGTLAGRVELSDGRKLSFFWDGDEKVITNEW